MLDDLWCESSSPSIFFHRRNYGGWRRLPSRATLAGCSGGSGWLGQVH
jgi:hypothetical protein